MSFEQAVEAFKRKKNARAIHEERRDAYKKMVKDFTALKYTRSKSGETIERAVTSDRIERREQTKNQVIPDLSDELLDFVKGVE